MLTTFTRVMICVGLCLLVYSIAWAQAPDVGVYQDELPRFECGSEVPAPSNLFFTLDVQRVEQHRIEGIFSTGYVDTDSLSDMEFDITRDEYGLLQAVLIETEGYIGEVFSPYKLELIWNPLQQRFEGLITNLNPFTCEDGRPLHGISFVELEKME